MRRRDLVSMPLAALAAPPLPRARAQGGTTAAWPTRPIHLVTSFAPGGPGDLIPRIIAQPLSAAFGQTVLVENRPGAGGTIGADAVAKAAPDGHTLGISNIAPHAVAPAAYPNVPYDPVRDFAHIAMLAEIPLALAVSAQGPVRDMGQFLALAQRTPGGLRVGTNGNASSAHVSLELLKRSAGAELVHVPYRGSIAAVTDVIGGRVEAAMTSLGEVGRNERLRVLAIAAPDRLEGWPAVPTFREAGYPDMLVSVWFGLSGPAGLPNAIADRLHREARAALARPEFAGRFADMGSGPDRGLSRAEFGGFVAQEAARWAGVVRAAGVRPE
jgi:tripartite-type tricarboxylate transporter receptor subunit TctC